MFVLIISAMLQLDYCSELLKWFNSDRKTKIEVVRPCSFSRSANKLSNRT